LDDNDAEVEANQIARDWLMDPVALARFVDETRPYFSRDKIESFARRYGRHPGIVLGRLHHDGLVPFKNLRGLLVKVKQPHLGDWIDTPGPA